MTNKIIDYRKGAFDDKICYCNSETIVKCGYQYTDRCPRICKLFEDEDKNLETLFTGNNKWREDEK